MRNVIFAVILALIPSISLAARLHRESWYQARWCAEQNGEMEVVMPDGTRCDCLTATHAVEFDFASKWAESIGQALLYASWSGKRGGIVLIIEKEKDLRYVERVNRVIAEFTLPIDTWTTRP